MNILHICIKSPIITDYIKFINENYNQNEHFFVFVDDNKNTYNLIKQDNILLYETFDLKRHFIKSIKNIIDLINKIKEAQKVILHGLFMHNILLFILAFLSGLYRKCYWVIWGNDLYSHILAKNCFKKSIQ